MELTDDTGLPAKAISNVAIQLFSSNVGIVSLGSTNVTIKANQVLAQSTFSTSYLPGTATVTASATGFTSGSNPVSVVGPAPLKLNIIPEPDKLALSSSGNLVISLTDLAGDPARAPSDVLVSLISSSLRAVTVQSTATILPGSIYTIASYSATTVAGNATLTVSSPGLQSSSIIVYTGAPGGPVSLKVFLGPSPVLSDNENYNEGILVGIVNRTGYAAVASSDITVQLTSSSSMVGSVQPSVTIPAGQSFVTAPFQSTFASGTTLITASASNLLPAQGTLATYGPVPAKLQIQGIPSTLPADAGTYQALSVALVDASGGPAVAPQDIVVQLSSSKADAVSVNSEAVIKQGTISKIVSVQTSVVAASANITASVAGLGSSTLLFKTVTPAPSGLAVYVAPAVTFSSTSKSSPLFVVQLQDSQGNPARARQTTNIVITSSNSLVMNKSISLTIAPGLDYAIGSLVGAGAGAGTFTASSPGLGSSTADLQLLQYPVVLTLTPGKPVIYANQTTSLVFTATFLGKPISNASVTWVGMNGIAIPANGTTSPAGQASSTFRPNGPGGANVTAVIKTPALGSLNFTAQLSILPVPQKAPPTIVQELRQYIIYIVVAVVALVGVSIYVFRVRRKKARAELEAGFEVVS
ncbi:MAG: hypothetical protein OK455_07970 [Thaumarchaeota archaeon]|nr:hypothetical protein [Nitrososphaerota archaeon]